MPGISSHSSSASTTKQRRAAPPAIAAPERAIGNVVLGDVLFETWYPSFYPEAGEGNVELGLNGTNAASGKATETVVGVSTDTDRLYVCRCCFKYSQNIIPYLAHRRVCESVKAGEGFEKPGQMIYDDSQYQVWEVDGEEDKLFCQNLSLFAKLFLDNKSVFYDVSSFLYYLLVYTPSPKVRPLIVGFFSKEKMSWDNNNLACILIFPPWQRKGLGKILMSISYEVSKREGRMGGPEKPLSDLGRRSYISFWSCEIARAILQAPLRRPLTIKAISQRTYILPEDVLLALSEMDVMQSPDQKPGGPGRQRSDGALPISKARIRAWRDQHNVQLDLVIDPTAFVEDWAPLPSWEVTSGE